MGRRLGWAGLALWMVACGTNQGEATGWTGARDLALTPLRVERWPDDLRDRHVLILAGHVAADGTTRPQIKTLLPALVTAGWAVVFVGNSDAMSAPTQGSAAVQLDVPSASLAGLLMRANRGLDFAAWAQALRLFPQLWAARSVTLMNDSVLGPIRPDSLEAVYARLMRLEGDVAYLTKSELTRKHYQSYFIHLSARALNSAAVRTFFAGVENRHSKSDVINLYEFGLTDVLDGSGLKTDILFDVCPTFESCRFDSPTSSLWRPLIEEHNFPFVKAVVLRNMEADATAYGRALTWLGRWGYGPAAG